MAGPREDPRAFDSSAPFGHATMSDRQSKLHELLLQALAKVNPAHIATMYREVLDEAARPVAPDSSQTNDQRPVRSFCRLRTSHSPQGDNNLPVVAHQ